MSDNPFLPPSSNPRSLESYGTPVGVSEKVLDGLRRTKGWVRFSGIMMIILFVMQLLNVVLTMGGASAFTGGRGASYAVGAGIGGLIFGILFVLWPGIRLLAYAKSIGRVLESKSTAALESALNEQRGFWKHIGIIVLIYIVLVGGLVIGAAVLTAGRVGR